MEKMPYYAITVRRYNILFRHTEWFHQTQDLYNEILLFYYQLYLETFPDEQPGTQEALRILEKLTIVGRDKQPVPNPIPWKKGSHQYCHGSSQKLSGKGGAGTAHRGFYRISDILQRNVS